MKKIISILCATVMLFGVHPQSFAETESVFIAGELPTGGVAKVIGETTEIEGSEIYSAKTSYSAEEAEKTLYEVLEEGMRAHVKAIDISRFGYRNNDADKDAVLDVLYRVVCENYDILSFTGYGGTANGGILTEIKPKYLFDSYETDVKKRAEMDEKINKYLALAEEVPDDAGKALVLHDAFCADNEYATEELDVYDSKAQDDLTYDDLVIFSPYGALINNRAVCQGISIALAEIYNRAGIETGFCQSDAMKHIWNVVKIDGKWYQLDATWNDSSLIIGKDEQGNKILGDKCYHNYFLCSDTNFRASHYKRYDSGEVVYDWEYYTDEGDIVCSDNSYESGKIYCSSYIYGGMNYGTYYGTVGWDGNRYVIDVWGVPRYMAATEENKLEKSGIYINMTGMKKFYSKSLTSYGIIATEKYQDVITTVKDGVESTETINCITLFANDNIAGKTDIRYGIYNGMTLNAVGKIFEIPNMNSSFSTSLNMGNLQTGGRMFFWKEGSLEPVAEAVEYK